MPLVAHSKLPSFARLREEGEEILDSGRAQHQDIRELHIGLLNMMPDAALRPTERQFMRLIGSCNRIAQFYVYPFTLPTIEREAPARAYVGEFYSDFETLSGAGLDALIITGANISRSDFTQEPFWSELSQVFDFARENVTSTLCACLATHAALKYFHGIDRRRLQEKRWGVYSHQARAGHPLIRNINTRFDVPHSRFNDISRRQAENAGIKILVASQEAGFHLAVSEDLFRFVYQQGHPEYDRNSLLKEYKREVRLFVEGEIEEYPPLPTNYVSSQGVELVLNYKHRILAAADRAEAGDFPETEILSTIDNTWGDSARSVFNNWLGSVYQLTNRNREKPFMRGVDPNDPFGIRYP